MTTRLDALCITEKKDRNGNDKTYFTRVGVAFPTKDGRGWMVYLDAFPKDGKLMLSPPREKGESQGGGDFIP